MKNNTKKDATIFKKLYETGDRDDPMFHYNMGKLLGYSENEVINFADNISKRATPKKQQEWKDMKEEQRDIERQEEINSDKQSKNNSKPNKLLSERINKLPLVFAFGDEGTEGKYEKGVLHLQDVHSADYKKLPKGMKIGHKTLLHTLKKIHIFYQRLKNAQHI